MLCMWTSVECWSYYYSNTTMDWEQARSWCRQHYTDMVAIQNQEEVAHLNAWLPRRRGYYWIGIRKINNVWTWVGTNKALTVEATNWAAGEPNNGKNEQISGRNEDCVEMYIKREVEEGKWNDERCNKQKTALCYTAACKNDSCRYGECVETINSHKCDCFEGFYGEQCEQVVKCNKEEVTVPNKGSVNCTHTYGDFAYNSSCHYSCEEGYQLSMSRPLRCTASREWSEQPPTCELVQCEVLSSPESGSMECSDPLGPSSYQSTCVFTCDEGYVLVGSPSNTLQCGASGNWTSSKPFCVAVQCPAIIQELENGVVSCGDDSDMKLSYGNTCSFSCASGYQLVGPSSVTCTSSAEWNERMPHCEAITCQNPEGDAHLITQCSQILTQLQPDSTCSFSCEAGFELQGAHTIHCSEDGQWSKAIPMCKATECPALEIPTNGQVSCSPSLSSPVSTKSPLGVVCTFSCDEGYELQGALSTKCAHPGQWTFTPPTCTAMRCPLLEAPENGQINCSDSEQVYNSQCSFTCNQDYSLDGHELLICDRHGNWTGEKPTCQDPPSRVTSIVTGVTAGGALTLSALSLAMWILKRLKQKATKFELNSNSDIEVPPQERNLPKKGSLKKLKTDLRMLQESVGLHQMVLIAVLIVFAQDLSSRGGAHAWTYTYSMSPIRRWSEAKQWCQQHFTDMVSIQNQEETDFINNLLPYNSKYYWIGIRKVGAGWIWDQTSENIPEEAQNWAPGEPDDIAGQDCVEIYIKRDKDTAKWNNENCLRKKATACYSASCTQDSCSDHADCVETVGNYTCQCHPGFHGPRCEEAIMCKPLLDQKHGSQTCSYPHGSNRFNSSCLFHCEFGFQLVGVPQLLCQASGHWNHPVPLCQVKQCPALNHTNIRAGSMNCSHPIAPYSYNSTCAVRCDEGYEPSGQDQIRCDHTGHWTASVPACTVKKCSPILFPAMGNMTCVHPVEPFSYSSQCNFTCQEGYYLIGDSTLTCLASKQWSKPIPTCKVVQCNHLKAPLHATMQCQDPLGVYSYGSICTVQCEEGFDLIGTNMTKCSSQGNWSHALPVCQVKRCNPINLPHGSLSCSDRNGPFSFGSRCTTSCDEGFLLNGTASTECNSLGMWSSDIPRCFAKKCPALNSPCHGSLSCSDPHEEFSFGSLCNITCEEGFVLNGTADIECTSLGTWSADIPRCLAKRCPTLNSPSHGFLSCSDPHEEFSFGSKCTSTCEEGFVQNGTADTECTSLGRWNTEIPCCLAQPCPLLAKAPQHGKMNCSHPHSAFSYGSYCDFDCNEGFWLKGTSTLTCNNSGHWSQDLPTCQPVECEAIRALSLPLSMNCSHPLGNFSFGSQCLFTCKEGFSLNGTEMLLCSSTGVWTNSLPTCTEEDTPLGAALLLYTGIGAASAAVPLVLIGLALLILTRFKKRGDPIMNDAPLWEERENPAFES
ncbi:P-selectin [Symphorus nematophorus]